MTSYRPSSTANSFAARAASLERWAELSPPPLAAAYRRRACGLRFLAEVSRPFESALATLAAPPELHLVGFDDPPGGRS